MVSWTDALRDMDLDGFSVRETGLPAYDEDMVIRCQSLCRDNLCGKYGTNWACPPGFSEHMDSLSEQYDSALLLSRTFACDPHDKDAVEECNTGMKAMLRSVVEHLRAAGIGCRGFSDGGCDLCQTCAYPGPCRFPDRVMPSVSAVGIDMGAYLESVGERFEFRDDRVTFYFLVFIKA